MDFIVLKVNGRDVSRTSTDEAVRAFRTATEPIVVEVLRRPPPAPPLLPPPPPDTPPPPSPRTAASASGFLRRMADDSAIAVAAKSKSAAGISTSAGNGNGCCPIDDSQMITTATQTDECPDTDFDDVDNLFPVMSPSPCGLYSNESPEGGGDALLTAMAADMSLTDLELEARLQECCDDDFGTPLDFEYETVTLHRISCNRKVGLTLCYGATYDDITDIFVGEIEPLSIAADDGRIREGDQIIQINGVDVHSREQAVQMFTESQSDVTLLLARPINAQQTDDGFIEVYNTLDDVTHQIHGMESTIHRQHQLNFDPFHHQYGRQSDEGTSTDATQLDSLARLDKDSGLGRTDESIQIRDSSVERDIIDSNCTSPTMFSNISASQQQQQQQQQRTTDGRVPVPFQPSPVYQSSDSCCGDVSAEIAALNREMERIQLQYREIVNAHRVLQDIDSSGPTQSAGVALPAADAVRSPRAVPRMGTRVDHAGRPSGAPGEPRSPSMPGTPARVRIRRPETSPRRREFSVDGRRGAAGAAGGVNGFSCSSRQSPHSDMERRGGEESAFIGGGGSGGSQGYHHRNHSHQQRAWNSDDGSASVTGNNDCRTGNGVGATVAGTSTLQAVYSQYADVMYTNAANLQHTIALQQNLFQQQLAAQQKQLLDVDSAAANGPSPSRSPRHQSTVHCQTQVAAVPSSSSAAADAVQMEWVVKRRPDGTRYITRRPRVRRRLLRERARQLDEERRGTTTDDDAASELKLGRYWTREERRQHIIRRRQKDVDLATAAVMRRHAAARGPGGGGTADPNGCPPASSCLPPTNLVASPVRTLIQTSPAAVAVQSNDSGRKETRVKTPRKALQGDADKPDANGRPAVALGLPGKLQSNALLSVSTV